MFRKKKKKKKKSLHLNMKRDWSWSAIHFILVPIMTVFGNSKCFSQQSFHLRTTITTSVLCTLIIMGMQIIDMLLGTFQSCLCLLNLFTQMGFRFLQFGSCFPTFRLMRFRSLCSAVLC
ncbi:hypothetical protein HOY80DRAFT_977806 [Tuber brumale]|nr:hypothetical protein HOY80DRAFT_977806 [Tuber brumale]